MTLSNIEIALRTRLGNNNKFSNNVTILTLNPGPIAVLVLKEHTFDEVFSKIIKSYTHSTC